MNLIQLIACIGLITGCFVLLRISPMDFTEGVFRRITSKPKSIRAEVNESTRRKKKSFLRREIEEFLIYNGLVCWRDGVDKSEGSKWFFGGFWGEPGSSWDGRLNEQVSASTMIEAMALLIE